MSTTPARKPNANRRSLVSPGGAPPRSPTPSRDTMVSGIPVASVGNASVIGRRHTIREGLPGHVSQGSLSSLRTGISARSAAKRASISGNMDDTAAELLEKNTMISELNQRIKKLEAEVAATHDSFGEQMQNLQARMEEAIEEAQKMEELLHTKDETIEGLEVSMTELDRRMRDQEAIYETEVSSIVN